MVVDINYTECGDHFTIYVDIESLYCTPEINVTSYVYIYSVAAREGGGMGAETAVFRDRPSSPGKRDWGQQVKQSDQWAVIGFGMHFKNRKKNPLLTDELCCRGETKRGMHCDF